MDDLERRLIGAFDRAGERLLSNDRDPAEVARLRRRVASKVVSGNLRSWAMVLRANDARITQAVGGADSEDGLQSLVVSGWDVRAWCRPMAIDPPGVSLSEAARRFGVNRSTVSRWADPAPEAAPEAGAGVGAGLAGDAQRPACGVGMQMDAPDAARRALNHGRVGTKRRVTWKQDVDRQIEAARESAAGCRFGTASSYRVIGRRLVLDYTVNRADRKRDVVRVWTPLAYGVDPGGEVAQADWGSACRSLVDRVPGGFEQGLVRRRRRLSARSVVWEWRCPAEVRGCGCWVAKLYWPMPVWTLGARVSEVEAARCRGVLEHWRGECDAGEFIAGGFRCRRCAGMVYESAERGSSPGRRVDGTPRRVDVWDRYVRRLSGGVLTGSALEAGRNPGV